MFKSRVESAETRAGVQISDEPTQAQQWGVMLPKALDAILHCCGFFYYLSPHPNLTREAEQITRLRVSITAKTGLATWRNVGARVERLAGRANQPSIVCKLGSVGLRRLGANEATTGTYRLSLGEEARAQGCSAFFAPPEHPIKSWNRGEGTGRGTGGGIYARG